LLHGRGCLLAVIRTPEAEFSGLPRLLSDSDDARRGSIVNELCEHDNKTYMTRSMTEYGLGTYSNQLHHKAGKVVQLYEVSYETIFTSSSFPK
jgi:hypothetical protein